MRNPTVVQNKFVTKLQQVLEKFLPLANNTEQQSKLLNTTIFQEIMKNAPGAFLIVNFKTNEYVYISPNITRMVGIDPSHFFSKGLSLTISLFPEKQQSVFADMYTKMLQACIEHKGALHKLRFTYTTAIRMPDGEWRNFMHQMTILEEDADGQPLLATKFMFDIHSFKKDQNVEYECALFDEKNGTYQLLEAFVFQCDDTANQKLTKREKEILDMISHGKSSKEIAEKMFISRYTVDNHRRNMRRKFEAANTSHLLNSVQALRV